MIQTTPVAQPAQATARPTARLLLRELLLHGLLLLLVAVATVIGYNSPTPIVVDALFRPERVFSGFYDVERNATHTFRWTAGAGTVCYDQLGYAGRKVVQLTLLGDGSNAIGIDQVALAVDGRPLTTAQVRPAAEHLYLLLDGSQRTTDQLCVTLESATAPAADAADRRVMGVPFERMVIYRDLTTGVDLPAVPQLGLNLAAAVVLFWVLRVLGLRARWALLGIGVMAGGVAAGVYAGWLDPGPEAARNLPPTLWLLGMGLGAVLLGGLGSQRVAQQQPAWLARLDTRLGRDLLLMLLWSGVLWGGIWLLQLGYGHSGAWPLKAGVWMNFTPLAVLPAAVGALWIALVLRGLHRPAAPWLLLGLVLLGAIVLPVLLKTSVRGWDSLFWTFRDNLSDYIQDVPRVTHPLTFLRDYVAISPTLAWHNANHPPGSVLLLWGVAQTLGAGPYIGSFAAIVLSSSVALAAWWLGTHLGGLRIALLAAALVAVMPGHTIYSVTSMDGLFNGLNALALVAFFLAMEQPAQRWRGVLAGLLIAIAFFFTYASTQLVFFGAAVALLALLRGQSLRAVVQQGMLVGATLLGYYLLLYAVAGFNMIDAVLAGKANNARLLSVDPTNPDPELMGFPPLDHYVRYLGVNIMPFLWYLAPWGLAALTPLLLSAVQRLRGRAPLVPADALILSLLVLMLGMWLSGLFVREVERIWGFVYPPAAVLIALHVWQGASERVRLWRAGLWLGLFFAQSLVMRMLLNTYW